MGGARKLGSYLSPAPTGTGEHEADLPSRPEGEVVWCHATTRTHADVALHLADRLANARPDIHVLLTGAPDILPQEPASVYIHPTPADTSAAAQAFVSHWRPDLCVWTAGDLKPAILSAAHRTGMPLYLVDADEARLTQPGWRLLPSSSRTALRRFAFIMARTQGTETFLRRRVGLRDTTIRVTGALREESKPLPYNESDHEELTGLLRGRPIWLAARLHVDELSTVLEANEAVIGMSHRVLLVIAPAEPDDTAPYHEALKASGMRYITWSEGSLPDETTQVILADTRGELGLWYRISPICFMGSSLIAGAHGSDPNEPAAHGSAILYGPNIRTYLAAYSRFAEAGAARIVRDVHTLAEAVQRVIPPDQSAAMAHAAWDVATQSAAVMDQLVDAILTALDERTVT
ncbi:3-deoxy-D-manno-octulosonic acid transferase [Roseovarius indicus]|uniref:3-deoxy-D-manno-octulosonic acid transferase n=1 Tax=Roseovarius indicus TaxID=540747 RepID=UPI0032ECA446